MNTTKMTEDQAMAYLATLNENDQDACYEVFGRVMVDGLKVTAYDADDLYLSGPVTTWTAQNAAEAAELKANAGRGVYRVTLGTGWEDQISYDEQNDVEVYEVAGVSLYEVLPGVEWSA